MEVSLFALRILNKRIPTKATLFRCGVVSSGSLLCTEGFGKEETINHRFLHCDYFSMKSCFLHQYSFLIVGEDS